MELPKEQFCEVVTFLLKRVKAGGTILGSFLQEYFIFLISRALNTGPELQLV